jgi:hypothetical protein
MIGPRPRRDHDTVDDTCTVHVLCSNGLDFRLLRRIRGGSPTFEDSCARQGEGRVDSWVRTWTKIRTKGFRCLSTSYVGVWGDYEVANDFGPLRDTVGVSTWCQSV